MFSPFNNTGTKLRTDVSETEIATLNEVQRATYFALVEAGLAAEALEDENRAIQIELNEALHAWDKKVLASARTPSPISHLDAVRAAIRAHENTILKS
ncbi:hypothetical protein L6654_24185 [Bradyrhizobium sp. WYCCWR 13023]|uniref:Uncharacterized protein n=1 Tax=Bradyrhizobium zhengyangense TaxID=2911009 RepID=A0A9X1RDY6_9BRAD|nr:hypothetical protein [Bradyrhizobium zhengyangense]MCG2629727.1 hypothetical protein [Bradyrhizobium zhengyangense]